MNNTILAERVIVMANEIKVILLQGDVLIFKPSHIQVLDDNKDLRYIDEVLALVSNK